MSAGDLGRKMMIATLLAAPGCARTSGERAATGAVGAVHEARLRLPCAAARASVPMLETLFRGDATVADARIRSVTLDERAAELVVVGTDAGIADVMRFIAQRCEVTLGDGRLEVVPLTHAAAPEVVKALARAGATEAGTRAIADVPTNSIILEGTPEQRARLRKAIAALDVP